MHDPVALLEIAAFVGLLRNSTERTKILPHSCRRQRRANVMSALGQKRTLAVQSAMSALGQ
jgi:hypothetical protein